jgi:hypothetical protein
MSEFKIVKVPALIDNGAQFSCIRSDVAEFRYLMEEPCVFTSCSVTCLLAEGQRIEDTDTVRLHVKILSFTWNYEFKILRGDPCYFGVRFLRSL